MRQQQILAVGLALILALLVGCNNAGQQMADNPPATGGPGDQLPATDDDDDPVVPDPDPVTPDPTEDPLAPRTRYSMANGCFALLANANDRYVSAGSAGYAADANAVTGAEAFYFKASSLGEYLLYNRSAQLAAAGQPVSNVALSSGDETALWSIKGLTDTAAYPAAPQFHLEPTPEQVLAYRSFVDPLSEHTEFQFLSSVDGNALTVDGDGALTSAAANQSAAQSFTLIPVNGCAAFSEAQSNETGEPFKGTTADGRVLGMADVHVHISATEFLAKAEWGNPFHKFGVTHALGDCDEYHGEMGSQDLVSAAFSGDTDGHDTTGWPTFPEWPGRNMLTHEAIYWRWLERAWKSGLRVVVNDLVDNETLCELQRNNTGEANLDCNPMNSVGRQAGTMYAMQDYIDAQYGGPGQGFYQIVHDSGEARDVIVDGKIAVVLGIEISNFLGCQVLYNSPARQLEPFEEDGSGGNEARYACSMEETGADNEILTQLNRLWGLGVRQIISIHEFDNAFGGNGIFNGFLNLGNKENSGGIPGGLLTLSPAALGELPAGELWTTYDCPVENETPGFDGYMWGNSGGRSGALLRSFDMSDDAADPTANCQPMGQGGRYGGPTNCYPNTNQCNARWMTPVGLYMYKKLMEMGYIIDFDHMELAIKDQLLDLSEAQPIAYPTVSTHGTFGGTSNEQARRVLRNGGFLYPSIGSSNGFINDMNETKGLYDQVFAALPEAERPLFGFGFGTDTNGLSGQSPPRGNIQAGREVVYPFRLFQGGNWEGLDDFVSIDPVEFAQPEVRDPNGVGRTWHQDLDGNAHYGMLSDIVHEIRLEGQPEHLRHMFNSAEVFLRTWATTEAAAAAIVAAGKVEEPAGILRPAPTP